MTQLFITFNLAFLISCVALGQEQRMIVYKTHEKSSVFGATLANSNAADALGSIKFLVENPMGLDIQKQEITAFKVVWQSASADFSRTYKECNKGMCVESALENNTNTRRGKAFGTLNLGGGGKWFSFEEADLCAVTDAYGRECFSYEVIGTFSYELMPIISLGYGTAAALELQGSFASIPQLLEDGWIDHAEYQPSSLQRHMEGFLKNNSLTSASQEPAEDTDWD